MPHAKPLGEGLHELRFTCENVARRITYVFDPERSAVTLTTTEKTQSRAEGSDEHHHDHDPWERARDDSMAAMTLDDRAEYEAAAARHPLYVQLSWTSTRVRSVFRGVPYLFGAPPAAFA